MADDVVLLRGGSRDGESTQVHEGVRRLLAASDAPGLVDIYEADGTTAHVAGNDVDALVFVHVGQENADEHSADALHPPADR